MKKSFGRKLVAFMLVGLLSFGALPEEALNKMFGGTVAGILSIVPQSFQLDACAGDNVGCGIDSPGGDQGQGNEEHGEGPDETALDEGCTKHTWYKTEYKWSDDYSTLTGVKTCTNCGAQYSETVDAHIDEEASTPATCEEPGVNVYVSDEFEIKTFEQQTVEVEVPALGHDWGEPTYEWSEDNKTVTATRVCKNNEEHKQTETVNATVDEEASTAATGDKPGVTVYVSEKFKNTAFNVQTKEVETEEQAPDGEKTLTGDLNLDGKVDLKDGLLMKQYLAQWPVKIYLPNADLNGDKLVDLKDGILMQQYLAKWPVTLV